MPTLLLILIFTVMILTCAVLWRLCVIDLKHRLLPNTYVFAFGVLGVAFHLLTRFVFMPPLDMAVGAALGGGILYAIRFIANWYYKQDALGLGDVKLMLVAGIWLGPQDVMLALSAGAFAGVLHGVGVVLWHYMKRKEWLSLTRLQIPAGPGFIVGILIAALAKFAALAHLLAL